MSERHTREPTVDCPPEFQLRMPNSGPIARGRLLAEKGTNGSQRFLVLAWFSRPERGGSSFPASYAVIPSPE